MSDFINQNCFIPTGKLTDDSFVTTDEEVGKKFDIFLFNSWLARLI